MVEVSSLKMEGALRQMQHAAHAAWCWMAKSPLERRLNGAAKDLGILSWIMRQWLMPVVSDKSCYNVTTRQAGYATISMSFLDSRKKLRFLREKLGVSFGEREKLRIKFRSFYGNRDKQFTQRCVLSHSPPPLPKRGRGPFINPYPAISTLTKFYMVFGSSARMIKLQIILVSLFLYLGYLSKPADK